MWTTRSMVVGLSDLPAALWIEGLMWTARNTAVGHDLSMVKSCSNFAMKMATSKTADPPPHLSKPPNWVGGIIPAFSQHMRSKPWLQTNPPIPAMK